MAVSVIVPVSISPVSFHVLDPESDASDTSMAANPASCNTRTLVGGNVSGSPGTNWRGSKVPRNVMG